MNIGSLSALNPLASSRMGLQAATDLINDGAQTIAHQSVSAASSTGSAPSATSSNDLTGALVQENQGLYLAKANVKGIEIINKTLDSLFQAVA
ncbi:MAG TPA: hypothetical protein PK820_12570 [Candidatus Competibacteraceae bacterium]|nr:hypothetical protein [Candidatus Competibacteraceae bacterium]